MKYLLDTHILICWAENNKKLKPKYKEIIADGEKYDLCQCCQRLGSNYKN